MDALQELRTIEALKTVKARYCRFLDTKNWEGFAALFTEDAIMDVRDESGLEPVRGRTAIIEFVRQVVQHAKTAHHVHSPEITLHGPDAADLIWAMQDRVVWAPGASPIPGASAITGYGHYHEHYVRLEGQWHIASLKLTRLNLEMQNLA